MLTQWFDPEPTFKGLAFAKELVKRGHKVEVLTGFPNYPGGRIYNGYKVRLFQREIMDGIPILRVPLFPSHDDSSMKRILNYASFAVSAAFLGTLKVKPADVMYVYHPPITVAFPAIILKLFRRIPFVYDIQDLWPDTLRSTGMLNNKFLLKIVDWWCRLTYRMADSLVVLSPGFKTKLLERGVPEKKVDVIYNWCDEAQILTMDREKAEKREPQMVGHFNVVFAGTMGKAQALHAVLDAAAIVKKKAPNVKFFFVGGGIEVEQLQGRADSEGLVNCFFLPRRPIAEIGPILACADVLLVHLMEDHLFRITIPSKTQAYMLAGRPILMAVRGDAANLVEKAAAGICCAPEAPESIANAVLALKAIPQAERERMGANGQVFYTRELSLQAGVKRFEELFQRIVRKK